MSNNVRITINDLELLVYLGVTAEERQNLQKVTLQITFNLDIKNEDIITDDLSKTICYDKIITFIIEKYTNTTYNLVERLCFDIKNSVINIIKSNLSITELDDNTANNIKISLQKKPVIKGFSGSISCEL